MKTSNLQDYSQIHRHYCEMKDAGENVKSFSYRKKLQNFFLSDKLQHFR